MKKGKYNESLRLWEESKKYIVPGSSTISKDPKLYTFGAYPIFLVSGKGNVVKDSDGNKYIDFQSSLGANILGNSYPKVNEAIGEQLGRGTLFSLSTPLQIELAKLICSMVPCAKRVRLLKNGSDATTAAVRIARAFTGKQKIVSCHFHGWHDWYYVITSMNRGIPQDLKKDIIEFKYNDIESLKKVFDENKEEIAAVIMEPVNLELPEDGFLNAVKKLTHENGALLIFDEVVTGFRFSNGGAQEYFGVFPDMCCLAKALGNGMPISAIAGKKDIFDKTQDVVTSMTYGEETLSLSAAIATLKELKDKDVVSHVWKLGEYFQKEYNLLAKKYCVKTKCIGLAPRLELVFEDVGVFKRLEIKAFFLQETAKLRILFGNMLFMNYSHTIEQVKKALKICEIVFILLNKKMEAGKIFLDGELPVELW